jgi:hypothetical protein
VKSGCEAVSFDPGIFLSSMHPQCIFQNYLLFDYEYLFLLASFSAFSDLVELK